MIRGGSSSTLRLDLEIMFGKEALTNKSSSFEFVGCIPELTFRIPLFAISICGCQTVVCSME